MSKEVLEYLYNSGQLGPQMGGQMAIPSTNPELQYLNMLQNSPQYANIASGGSPISYRPITPNSEPLSSGIRAAIEAAKTSLEMSPKQQDKAIRRSLLTFGQNIASVPRQKGFGPNLGAAARAMLPAMADYDQAESEYEKANYKQYKENLRDAREEQRYQDMMALRDQTLAEQRAQHAEQGEQREWQRDLAERKFAEDQRVHDFQMEQAASKQTGPSLSAKERARVANTEKLVLLLDQAEELVKHSKKKGHRSLFQRYISKQIPGGMPLNEHQASVQTLGDLIKGALNKDLGYTYKVEFEHVPTISIDMSPSANLAIIKSIRGQIMDSKALPAPTLEEQQDDVQQEALQDVIMQDTQGETYNIPAARVEEALQDGLVIME